MMPEKCILLLLDGLGDRSHQELGHRTPLQAAKTPFLDHLAQTGACGLYHAAAVGQSLPSENAHFFMFGYDLADFPGRGALEALGAGIDLGPDDVAILAHFVCLRESDGRLMLKTGKPVASITESESLFKAVAEYQTGSVYIRMVRTGGLNGILILSGEVSPYITDTDPFIDGRPLIEPAPWQSHAREPSALQTAAALKSFLTWTYRRLSNHAMAAARLKKGLQPINGIVTQRAGRLKKATPFIEKYGLRGLSIASDIVYHGIAAYLGFGCKKVSDTKDPSEDIARRLSTARTALKHYDFVHVHTKAADAAGHTKRPALKKRAIESLDWGIGRALGPFLDDPDVLTVVATDHSTPSSGPLIHSGEWVPLLFHGTGVRRDSINRFDEVNTAAGALGTVRGKELIYLILNHLDRSKLNGIMDTPLDQPFWPGNYNTFRLE